MAIIRAFKFVTKNFTGEKEKWTNKGNDKPEEAESLLHDTSSHTHSSHRLQFVAIIEAVKSMIKNNYWRQRKLDK